jgi:hypothetical protein
VNCTQLSNTGFDASIGIAVAIGLVCVVVGTVLALAARRRRTGFVTALVILMVASTVLILPAPSAEASTSDCLETGASVRVTQTSTMEGLAPGIAPVPITGLLTNTGTEAVHVTAVDVVITSITVDPASGGRSCDATDYLLLEPRMPVGRTIAAGQAATFTGASIGFSNKLTIQDDCQKATVHLLYTVD